MHQARGNGQAHRSERERACGVPSGGAARQRATSRLAPQFTATVGTEAFPGMGDEDFAAAATMLKPVDLGHTRQPPRIGLCTMAGPGGRVPPVSAHHRRRFAGTVGERLPQVVAVVLPYLPQAREFLRLQRSQISRRGEFLQIVECGDIG